MKNTSHKVFYSDAALLCRLYGLKLHPVSESQLFQLSHLIPKQLVLLMIKNGQRSQQPSASQNIDLIQTP
eukprot:UN18713